MADPNNPFADGRISDPLAGLTDPKTYGNIVNQWNSFLDAPGGRASLLSMGLALMQPPSFGDTPTSQIGRAIGAGGETVARNELMDIKQLEAESKAQAREAAANLAGARAANVGTAAQLQTERLQTTKGIADLKASNTLHQTFNKHLRDIADFNAKESKAASDILNPRQPNLKPIPTFEEWLATDPGAQDIARRSGMQVAPSAAPTTTKPAGGVTDAPPNPADRQPGVTYNTPRGPLTWTGTGWR